jgi:glycosyltransferase involved in cell wall biosynthesis
MTFSAVIVNYEGGDLLVECVRSLYEQEEDVDVIVVDNGSEDGSANTVARLFPAITVVRPFRNLGFAGGANAGAEGAEGELLLFLNPDVKLAPGCLDALRRLLADPAVGVGAPGIHLDVSGHMEYGATLDLLGHPVALRRPARPLFVTGCALAMRKSLFEELGGFDDRYFMFVEDVDLCWRALLQGFDIRVARDAVAFHVGGAVTPGGYERDGRIESSSFRIGLRERNTLATMIKCWGGFTLALMVPAYVIQTLVTAAALRLLGNRRTARELMEGLLWNGHELRRTLALRRNVQARRRTADVDVLRRLYRGSRKVEVVLRRRLPVIVDEGPAFDER